MNRTILAAALAAQLALVGCSGLNSVVTEPPSVQAACTLITLALPVAEGFRGSMTAAQQAMLTSAEGALKDCVAGNAGTAILDVATAIEQYLAGNGVTKAALMARAARPR